MWNRIIKWNCFDINEMFTWIPKCLNSFLQTHFFLLFKYTSLFFLFCTHVNCVVIFPWRTSRPPCMNLLVWLRFIWFICLFQKCLTTLDLTSLGVGSCVATGMYLVAGMVASKIAGPGVVVSFVIAALASLFSGLSHLIIFTLWWQ